MSTKLTKNIYIGVYGTGDKTYALVENEDGQLIGEGQAGTANFYLSIKQAWDSIYTAINKALSKNNMTLNSSNHKFLATLGIKNTEIPEACNAFIDANTFLDKVNVVSDAYALCIGAHDNQSGSIIIIDEGVTGYAINDDKTSIKVGGWGFPHADKGSTAWLGCEAIRLTLEWQDGYIDQSPMLNDVFEHFNENLNDIVEWSMKASPKNFADFYKKIVKKNIKKKDPHAIKLMQQVIAEIEKMYITLLKKLHKDTSPCCLFGELATYVQSHVSAPLCNNLVKPKYSGAKGALILLRGGIK